MNQPRTWTAWLPASIALLLIGLAGYWLGQALPSGPQLPLVAAAPVVSSAAGQAQYVPPQVGTTPAYTMPSDETSDSCWTGPLRFERGNPAAQRPLLLRHYVGTVGGQSASALLQWQHPDSVSGTCYLHRQGPTLALTGTRHRPGPLVLRAFQENPVEDEAGEWRLTKGPGGQLLGTWQGGPGGRSQAVVLRESYAGAMRLAIETTYLRGGWAIPGYEHCINVPTVSNEFLCPSASATIPLGLQPLLAPARADRRRATQALRDGGAQVTARVSVRLNDWNLLSYQTTTTTSPYEGRTMYAFKGSPLLDVASGQVWPLGRLLRPGSQAALRRLVANHLLHDAKYQQYAWLWAERPISTLANDTILTSTLWLRRELVPRPEAYVLTSEGLEVLYWQENLVEQSESKWLTTVLVSYRELRPLVCPGTPLARMLQARGMW